MGAAVGDPDQPARAVNNREQVLGHYEAASDQGIEVTVVAWG